ncbi:TetR/AcrR family transcriptional regulator [Enterococcus sp. 669A]|uniref:TetR/AcrR family transcriptional regulator n=1 Tax=Candidatus Enterococcus moelleringii TaxID=2815325 RepID=A0ABS3LC80_9ENTE|nr:TetR/AcrR family transcriptional regulator [Enterococcus sp. 669A]MBO1307241.1 TetR/AcrR family transcriptional regulator [Enterococcus sp. 669A]
MTGTIREKKKLQTRTTILETASDLFAAEGFQLSTSKIAKTAGVAHGSLFLHFPTREDLIDAVIRSFFEELNTRIHQVTETTGSLEEFLRQHLEMLEEKEAFYTQLITSLNSLPATTQRKLFAYQSTLSSHLLLLLEKEDIVAVAPHMLFNTWLGIIHYYLQNKAMFASEESVIARYRDEWITTYIKLIRKG